MLLSDDGLRLIKSFEGYHRKLKDGSCIAYRCPAGGNETRPRNVNVMWCIATL